MTFPTGFKPMLSATLVNIADAHKLNYPAYISAKIDGIRCITDSHGNPITRNGKLVMNQAIVSEFQKLRLPYLDGELGLGDPRDPEFFNRTSALVRRKNDPDFETLDFYVFDRVAEGGYEDRFINIEFPVQSDSKIRIQRLPQRKVYNEEQFIGWEQHFVDQNYEGIMIRTNLQAPYKFGRPSLKQGQLIKFKRFQDDEAVITGFVEMMQNNNEATKDEWGHTTRSSHQENLTGKGMAGVILAQCDNFQGVVRIGTGLGLTHALRLDMWNNPHKYIGRTFTFEYQAGSDYEATRFGSFKGWRDGVDNV